MRSFSINLYSTIFGVHLSIASEDKPALQFLKSIRVKDYNFNRMSWNEIKVVVTSSNVCTGMADK